MLKNFFISEVRVNILKMLLLNPEANYHVRAIVRGVHAEINAVRRELDNLTSINFLFKRQSSNKLFYRVNTLHPFYPEILALVAKEDGHGYEILKNANEIGGIDYAVVSSGFLRGRTSTVLDVDLFIVGNANLEVLGKLVKSQELKYGREINFSTMTMDEFMYRKRTSDSFVMRVLSQGRAMLIGDEDKFCSLTQ